MLDTPEDRPVSDRLPPPHHQKVNLQKIELGAWLGRSCEQGRHTGPGHRPVSPEASTRGFCMQARPRLAQSGKRLCYPGFQKRVPGG